MDYEQEKKSHISYCGSYCHICDWHTGRIKKTGKNALELIQEYDGFKRILKDIDIDNLSKGLEYLATSKICSGCKSEIKANERCKIRQCCSSKRLDLCSECSDFPCDTLKNNPGVKKWHCLENLKKIEEIGLEKWIDKQWLEYLDKV
jgi:hypothetical protein